MPARPSALPTGTVTFFFSDVQDSTGLLRRLGSGSRDVIERHAAIIRKALHAHRGVEVSTEGDSFFAVFQVAADAVAAAGDIQQAMAAEPWPDGGAVAVRIGLHAGTAEPGHDNYVGIDVNRAARIANAAHGGQIVVSESVRALVAEATYTDLGEHSLRGLERPEHMFQVDVAGLPQAFPPLRTQSARPNNLPALGSRLVGRQDEVAELNQMIAANRLVTITGPGGIGKTRLAVEAAGKVLDRFDQGAFFVDLAPVDDPALVLPGIASAVGVDGGDNGGLVEALSDGPRLLVLDNFEQVSGAAPELASLLAAAPPLKLLVTSQVPLRVADEHVFRLAPLAASGATSPAVELFTARARQADPAFRLDDHQADVVQLVEALDGVPLAIELAAARVNVLTPGEILARLGAGVLKTSRSDAPDRHRSLAAAVEWSYGLLTPEQQALLQAMSVFRGGTTIGALEAVAGTDPLDDLGELVDHSLVEPAAGTVGKRFHLLAPVQLFASAALGDDPDRAARHADYFVELSRQAHKRLERDEMARWLAILEDEHANLTATLDFLLSTGDVQRGYEVLGSIWRFYQTSGRLAELDLWLGRFFAADEMAEPTRARAQALIARAALRYWRVQWGEAAADYEAAIAIAEDLGDKAVAAEAFFGLAATRGNAFGSGEMLGDPVEPALRAKAFYEEIGDLLGMGAVAFTLLFFRAVSESVAPAPEDLLEIVNLHGEAGSLMHVAHGNMMLAETYIIREDYPSAAEAALESLRFAEEAGDVFTMSLVLRLLAIVTVEGGDPELGARLDGAGQAARDRTGGSPLPPVVPIRPALDRARDLIGAAADTAYEQGRDLGLFEAVAAARRRLGG